MLQDKLKKNVARITGPLLRIISCNSTRVTKSINDNDHNNNNNNNDNDSDNDNDNGNDKH